MDISSEPINKEDKLFPARIMLSLGPNVLTQAFIASRVIIKAMAVFTAINTSWLQIELRRIYPENNKIFNSIRDILIFFIKVKCKLEKTIATENHNIFI